MKTIISLMLLLLASMAMAVPEINVLTPVQGQWFNQETAQGIYVLSANITDLNASIAFVEFSINSTNITLPAMYNNVSWIADLNLSQLEDGDYTLFTTAVNSMNETTINNTYFGIDRVKPLVTVVCSPEIAQQGAIVSCTCTARDSGSGLQAGWGFRGSGLREESTTAEHSGESSICRATDLAGNAAEAKSSWKVEETPRGSGGGYSSGGSSGGGSRSTTKWDKLEYEGKQFRASIAKIPDKGFKLEVNNPEFIVRKVEFNTDKSNVDFLINQLTQTPYKAYSAFELKSNDKNLEEVTVTFRVQKTWLINNKYDTVYIEHGTEKLPVTLKEELTAFNYYFFKTNSFSLFVVRGVEGVKEVQEENKTKVLSTAGAGGGKAEESLPSLLPVEEKPTEQPKEVQKERMEDKQNREGKIAGLIGIGITIMIVLIIVVVVKVTRKKEKEQEDLEVKNENQI